MQTTIDAIWLRRVNDSATVAVKTNTGWTDIITVNLNQLFTEIAVARDIERQIGKKDAAD